MSKNKTAENKKVIDSLTKEQEAMIPVYRERFRQIGLSTEPTDRAKAEDAIRRSYAYFHKLNNTCVANPEIVWAGGPMEGAKLAAQYAKGDENVTSEEIRAQASQASYGSFEAYWVSTYAFIAEQLNVEKDELIDIAVDIVKECGVYWTFEDLVVLTPKPQAIVMVEDKLHNPEGPALAYENGDCLYAINGEVKANLMEIALANRVAETASDKKAANE